MLMQWDYITLHKYTDYVIYKINAEHQSVNINKDNEPTILLFTLILRTFVEFFLPGLRWFHCCLLQNSQRQQEAYYNATVDDEAGEFR